MERDRARRFWLGQARRLARRVSVAAWLEAWLPLFAGATVAAALTLLVARRAGAPAPAAVVVGWSVALAVAAVVAGWRARMRFEKVEDGLVRIEAGLGLHSRLSAARAGVVAWPAPRAGAAGRVRWRLARIGAPLLAPLLLLAAAQLVPIEQSMALPRAAAPPLAWSQVDEWLAGLSEQRLASAESLAQWRDRLDELRRTPPDSWYDHATLEAGDALRDRLEGAIGSLERGLQGAAREVGALADRDREPELSRALRKRLAELEGGELAVGRELADSLRSLSREPMPELGSTELDALERRLAEGAGRCRAALGRCPPGDPDCVELPLRAQGSPERGPGSQPLALGPEPPAAVQPELEGVAGELDARRAALGELVGTGRTAHRVDDGDFAAGGSAGTAGVGSGGDAVWRDTLTPREREILRRYFR